MATGLPSSGALHLDRGGRLGRGGADGQRGHSQGGEQLGDDEIHGFPFGLAFPSTFSSRRPASSSGTVIGPDQKRFSAPWASYRNEAGRAPVQLGIQAVDERVVGAVFDERRRAGCARLAQKRSDLLALILVVGRDQHQAQPLRAMRPRKAQQRRHLFAAGVAPGRPDVDQHRGRARRGHGGADGGQVADRHWHGRRLGRRGRGDEERGNAGAARRKSSLLTANLGRDGRDGRTAGGDAAHLAGAPATPAAGRRGRRSAAELGQAGPAVRPAGRLLSPRPGAAPARASARRSGTSTRVPTVPQLLVAGRDQMIVGAAAETKMFYRSQGIPWVFHNLRRFISGPATMLDPDRPVFAARRDRPPRAADVPPAPALRPGAAARARGRPGRDGPPGATGRRRHAPAPARADVADRGRLVPRAPARATSPPSPPTPTRPRAPFRTAWSRTPS